MRQPVDVDEPWSGDDVLHGGATVPGPQFAEQVDFSLGAGGEVGAAGFRRRGDETAANVVQQRLAEPGAGRDDSDVAGA